MLWKTRALRCLAAGTCLVCWTVLIAAEPKGEPLVVTDSGGKEQKLQVWKITTGVRHLGWLAPADKKEPEKKEPAPVKGKLPARPAVGPLAFEMREENSTGFADGILTLLPLEHIRSMEFDPEKKSIAVQVLTDKDDVTLTGTTRYVGINKVSIEAELDKGDMGVAEVRFLGGVPKGGIRKVVFPAPKMSAAAQGRPAVITDTEKDKKGTHPVTDLQPLYQFADGSERLVGTLSFKKTLKLDLAKITKVVAVGDKPKEPDGIDWIVTTKDGEEVTLSLLKTATLDDQPARLEGFVGRVPGGYRLFPLGTIAEIQFDAKSVEEK